MAHNKKNTIFRVVYTVIIGVLAVTMVLPFIWMISTSFKVEMDVFSFPIEWIPRRWNFTNYAKAWNGKFDFPLYYLNTIKITILTTICQVLVSALAAYAFARVKFKLNKIAARWPVKAVAHFLYFFKNRQ